MNLTPSPALTTCKQSVNSRQFIQSGFPDPPDALFPVFVNQPSRPRGDPTPSPTIPPIPVRPPPPTQSGLSPQHQEKESPDPAPPGSPTQANRRPRVRCSARRAGASRTPGAGHSSGSVGGMPTPTTVTRTPPATTRPPKSQADVRPRRPQASSFTPNEAPLRRWSAPPTWQGSEPRQQRRSQPSARCRPAPSG